MKLFLCRLPIQQTLADCHLFFHNKPTRLYGTENKEQAVTCYSPIRPCRVRQLHNLACKGSDSEAGVCQRCTYAGMRVGRNSQLNEQTNSHVEELTLQPQ